MKSIMKIIALVGLLIAENTHCQDATPKKPDLDIMFEKLHEDLSKIHSETPDFVKFREQSANYLKKPEHRFQLGYYAYLLDLIAEFIEENVQKKLTIDQREKFLKSLKDEEIKRQLIKILDHFAE